MIIVKKDGMVHTEPEHGKLLRIKGTNLIFREAHEPINKGDRLKQWEEIDPSDCER